MASKQHTIRIPSYIWDAFKDQAEPLGIRTTQHIISALRANLGPEQIKKYVSGDKQLYPTTNEYIDPDPAAVVTTIDDDF